MEELHKFYKANYSSNLMNLVLVGRHSLDQLQELAETNFSGVENRDLPQKDFSGERPYDLEHSFGKIVKIIPNKDIKKLSLQWVLPSTSYLNEEKT